MTRVILVALATITLAALPAAAQVSITACGQTVPAGETGVLEMDLTCDGGSGTFGVAVENRGTLDMAGHTLAGGTTGVRCQSKRCAVTSLTGTGTIQDMTSAAIAVVEDRGKLSVSNVDLDNNLMAVLMNYSGGKLTGGPLTIAGSGIAIQAGKIMLTGLTATGNYKVTQARKTMLEDSTITGSEDTAISGQKASLKSSSVTGSGSGIDLLTDRRPHLVDSTCGVSRNLSNPVETWGVCTDD
jgi:hypothetical protein